MIPDNRLHQGFIVLVHGRNGLEHMTQSDAGFLALLRGNGQALEGIFTLGLGSRDHGPDGGTQAHGGAPPLLVIQTLGSTAHQDRKSTRLNSSHVKISYAVFCLKKKKE